jgi:hypothetical protein
MAIIFANLRTITAILFEEVHMKLIKSTMTLACFSIFSLQAMEAPKENLLAAYNKPLISSPDVIDCFKDISPQSNTLIAIQRGLFSHLCTQAAHDTNFKPTDFCKVMEDIDNEEDRASKSHRYACDVLTQQSASFHKLLQFIPWNGNVDKEQGIAWHSTLLNDKCANIGFIRTEQAKNLERPVIVNVYGPADYDVDSKIVEAFKTLLEAAQKKPSLNPLLTADEVARIQTICISNVWWNRSLISPNFEEMAHGNNELANEIRDLYRCSGYISAMLTFKGLCQKWGFDTSKVLKNAGEQE